MYFIFCLINSYVTMKNVKLVTSKLILYSVTYSVGSISWNQFTLSVLIEISLFS